MNRFTNESPSLFECMPYGGYAQWQDEQRLCVYDNEPGIYEIVFHVPFERKIICSTSVKQHIRACIHMHGMLFDVAILSNTITNSKISLNCAIMHSNIIKKEFISVVRQSLEKVLFSNSSNTAGKTTQCRLLVDVHRIRIRYAENE